VGWVDKLYRLQNPGPGVDPDEVDKLWDPVEKDYRAAVERLENRSENAADIDWLVQYVCAAGMRRPDFGGAVNRWRAVAGDPPLTGDDIQIARKLSLSTALAPIKQWRWRMAHSRPDDPRFIISDLGWVYVGQPRMRGCGLYIPLTARLAVLAWADPANRGNVDHQDMRAGGNPLAQRGVMGRGPRLRGRAPRRQGGAGADDLRGRRRQVGCPDSRRLLRPRGAPSRPVRRPVIRSAPSARAALGNLILPLGDACVFVAQVRS
jgi:hypothetical protein